MAVQVTTVPPGAALFVNGTQQGTSPGQVQMPMGETFWAKRFGMGVDRFGTPWMVNCSKEG